MALLEDVGVIGMGEVGGSGVCDEEKVVFSVRDDGVLDMCVGELGGPTGEWVCAGGIIDAEGAATE